MPHLGRDVFERHRFVHGDPVIFVRPDVKVRAAPAVLGLVARVVVVAPQSTAASRTVEAAAGTSAAASARDALPYNNNGKGVPPLDARGDRAPGRDAVGA